MDPATITLILQVLVKYGPEAYIQARKLLTGKVTDADWLALDAILEKQGKDYFPDLKPKVTP